MAEVKCEAPRDILVDVVRRGDPDGVLYIKATEVYPHGDVGCRRRPEEVPAKTLLVYGDEYVEVSPSFVRGNLSINEYGVVKLSEKSIALVKNWNKISEILTQYHILKEELEKMALELNALGYETK
ncbi:hypothetical protein N9878_00470 [bacterium]|nr:hypothetical protein [bacterium]